MSCTLCRRNVTMEAVFPAGSIRYGQLSYLSKSAEGQGLRPTTPARLSHPMLQKVFVRVWNCPTWGEKKIKLRKRSAQFVPKRTSSIILKQRWRSRPQKVGPTEQLQKVQETCWLLIMGVGGGCLLTSPHSGYSKRGVMSLQPRWNTEPVGVNESSQFSNVPRHDTCTALAKRWLCGATQQWNMAVYGRVVWLELHTAMLVSTAFADFLSSPKMVLPRAGWFIECSQCNSYTVEGPMVQITHSYYVLKACPQ